jgi:glycosyl transferase family 25
MKFQEFFERIYVINLPHRVDRRIAMEQELENAGMPFTPGKVELFAAIKPDSAAPFEKIGYKGCFLSHLSILKLALAANLSNVLIMEDDLSISNHFKQYEDILIENLCQTNWDIVHFGYFPEKAVNPSENTFATFQPLSEEITGLHFYAVNGRILERLINYFELSLHRPLDHPDGGPISVDGSYNLFQLQNPDILRLISLPCFGTQRSSRSDISPKWFDNLPIIKELATVARSVLKN